METTIGVILGKYTGEGFGRPWLRPKGRLVVTVGCWDWESRALKAEEHTIVGPL